MDLARRNGDRSPVPIDALHLPDHQLAGPNCSPIGCCLGCGLKILDKEPLIGSELLRDPLLGDLNVSGPRLQGFRRQFGACGAGAACAVDIAPTSNMSDPRGKRNFNLDMGMLLPF